MEGKYDIWWKNMLLYSFMKNSALQHLKLLTDRKKLIGGKNTTLENVLSINFCDFFHEAKRHL